MQNQNLVSNAGNIQVGSEYIRISSTGSYSEVDEVRDILLGQANGKLIYLSDVAKVSIAYQDPPRHIYRFNGKQALSLGVSFSSGVNVVEIGERIRARIADLDYARPIGIELSTIYVFSPRL